MQKLLNKFIPFIFIGIAIVAFAFGILLLAYLFMFGAIIGLGLFAIAWIKQRFFAPKTPVKTTKRTGRVIDSNDWKEL